MFPRSAMGSLPNSMIGQIQFTSYGMNRLGLEELPNLANIILGQFGHGTLLTAIVIGLVLMIVQIAYVFGAIVQTVMVDVMNVMPFWARADEGECNEFVNIPFSTLIVFEEPQVIIATLHAKRFVFGVMGLGIAALCGYALPKPFDLSRVANLVQAFISRYVAILFNGIMGLHRNLPFCAKPGAGATVARRFSLGATRVIVAQKG